MNTNDIEVYTVAEIELDEGWLIQARWYGGSGVNIYVENKEVDYFSNFSMKTRDDFVEVFADYLRYQKESTEQA